MSRLGLPLIAVSWFVVVCLHYRKVVRAHAWSGEVAEAEGLRVQLGDEAIVLPWTEWRRWRRNMSVVLIYPIKGQPFLLSRGMVATREDFEALQALLEARLGKAF